MCICICLEGAGITRNISFCISLFHFMGKQTLTEEKLVQQFRFARSVAMGKVHVKYVAEKVYFK